jgi:DNA (cytosine-5)-methyltransferase 1
VVASLNPGGFLIENVVGLRDMKFVEAVCSLFMNMGYVVTPMIIRAADYGVPQLRHRIFFVGSRNGLFFRSPPPRCTERTYVTVWDAIGDLPPLLPGDDATDYVSKPLTPYQTQMRKGSLLLQGHVASSHPEALVRAISYIPDGGNRTHIPHHLQPRSGFHNSYSRLNSKSPAVAITQNMGKPSATRCIHPFQDRGLTTREGARLQGFPDRFHFLSGMTSQRLQVANAVSPILAEVLGHALVSPDSWMATRAEDETLGA